MAHTSLSTNSNINLSRTRLFMMLCIIACLTLLPSLAFAQEDSACDTVSNFATNIQTLLNAISIVVVTIAIIFSGYQIAFAHKRMGDVAPALIGAVLIGAASQIAKMFLGGDKGVGTAGCTATYFVDLLHSYA